jgi:hypothetical protein
MSRRATISARQRNREKIRAALGAVRKEVRTIPREQAREILIAEFRKQGVDPQPSDANVEVFLDYLALTNPLKRALFATRALTEAFRPAFSAIREIKEVFGDALVLKGGPDTIDVPVDREAPTIMWPRLGSAWQCRPDAGGSVQADMRQQCSDLVDLRRGHGAIVAELI